jgi:hypothetical protein
VRIGVNFAARDATDVVQQLKNSVGGMYCQVDERVLTCRVDTSLSRIEAEITGLTTRARPEDVVVIGKPAGKRHEVEATAEIDIRLGPRRALAGAGL